MQNARARELRKRLTPQEVKLWVKLRDLRTLGYHFRRQAPIGPFIADFVCFKHHLIIEADGGQHGMNPHILRDMRRNDFLRSQGFRVLRFWNSDIDHYLDGVVETIVAELKPPPRPADAGRPSPQGGGRRSPYPNSRNSRRNTLPVAVIGKVSANWMWRGYSCAASCTLTKS